MPKFAYSAIDATGAEIEGTTKADTIGTARSLLVERNLFPAATMMPLDVLSEAVLSVLAVRGYVDDIAVMPRTRDPKAGA